MAKAKVEQLLVGVDIGHGYTKTELAVFASKVKVGKAYNILGRAKKDTYAVEYNGQDYIVGEGTTFTGEDRYFTLEYKLCLLVAIALNNPTEDFIDAKIVVGTPLERRKRLEAKIVNEYRGIQEVITLGGKEITIRIQDVAVFWEGAYPVITEEEGRIITVDMGAGTIDVTEFVDGIMDNVATYNDSMYKMYSEVATFLNMEKGGDFRPADIEAIINRSTATINTEKVDITDIRPIIASNIAEISSLIKNAFNVGRADAIHFIGGGSMDMYQYWKKQFPTSKLATDSQMVNVKVYNAVAKGIYEEE